MNAKVIAVWGANGSGKSTTAVNLAFSLSQRNFTVGLISSNIYYGEMQMLCGCNIPDDRGIMEGCSILCTISDVSEETAEDMFREAVFEMRGISLDDEDMEEKL